MIAKLRALLAAATQGKWEVQEYPDKHGQAVVRNEHIEIATLWHHSLGSIEKKMYVNAALIVAAHNSLPALLDCVEKAKAMRDVVLAADSKGRNLLTAFDAAYKRLGEGE